MSNEIFDDFKRAFEEINQAVIWPTYIKASPKVPRNSFYRQWDTNGRLILWVNREELDDLPRTLDSSSLHAPMTLNYGLLGIPVLFSD